MIIYFTALFAYYNDGNVTSIAKDKKAVSIGYDINNRLTSYGQTKYTYDAEGNRIKKETGETATTYLYDTSGTLPRVFESKTGEELTVYIYGKELISQQTGESTEYYHYDYRGSTVALTDKTGNVTDRYSYDVYGNSDHITGTETTPFQYTGSSGVQTDENGLMYMCTRYYSPEIMRFLSADVLTGDVKNTQSLNRYAYCQGNPISFTDPFGMSPEVRAHNEKERAKAVRQTVSLRVHNVLDAGGMFPAAGAFADGTNGMIYLIEGDMEGVAFSAIAFIPVIGQVSTPAKYLDDGAELAFKYGDDLAEAVWHSDDAFRFTMGYSDDPLGLLFKESEANGNLLHYGDDFWGVSKAEAGWDMSVGGGNINGRRYSQHAMERMAPNTPEVKAELYQRATKIAKEKGLLPQTKEYSTFIDKYVDPRNIPPSVIEDAIKNAKPNPGNRPDTFVHATDSVKVIANGNGDVITVIPK